MAALALTLWETGQCDEALATWREMLCLNPNDNQGVRYRLMAALLELQRDAEAKELEKAYMDDGVAEWLYAVSLLIFRAEGDSVAARRKLQTALQQNPHVPSYLLGRKKLPKYLPDQYIVGGEDEAVICAAQLLPSWVKTPAALDWLGVEQAKKSHKAFHSSVKGKA
jgi:tetratricopeptide (TPR) repeat protein